MNIVLLGVNHKTAPIEVRERLAIEPSRLAEATLSLVQTPGVREGMILSTCNRVELLLCQESSDPAPMRFLHDYFSLEPALLHPHLYEYREREAVRHLFRVASSLDSMVVGEPQILGQVKESYTVARSVGAVQTTLDKLLQSAFTVAKKVRTETQIGSSSVSIASVAVELAQKIFGSLDGKKVFLVGAGKMSELAARQLIQQGASSILVTNRTHDRAITLAKTYNGQVIRYEDLYATADQADIIITSTGAPHAIFKKEHGQQFMHRRRNRPMFFIDIAVPRDVDPAMNRVEGIFLYDIDDLQSVAASHLADRAREAEQAEDIVTREVDRYQQKLQTLNVVPVIVDLQRSVEDLRQAELRRMQSRLQSLTPEQQAAVDALTKGLMNKFLHTPLQAIKSAARSGDSGTVDVIRSVFDLTQGSANSASNGIGHSAPAEPATAATETDAAATGQPEPEEKA